MTSRRKSTKRSTAVQRVVQQNADSSAQTSGNGAPASDALFSPAAPIAPTRTPNPGWFTPGHTRGRLTTGIYSDHLPPGLEHIAAEVERFNAGALLDEGDVDEIPARRRSQLDYRGVIHQNILGVAGALAQRGLVDRRGKLRVAWLSKLESLIAAAVRIDNLLGLARRPKNANVLDAESAAEYVRLADQHRDGGLRDDAQEHHDTSTTRESGAAPTTTND